MAEGKFSKLSLIAIVTAGLFLISVYFLVRPILATKQSENDTTKNTRLLPMRTFDGRYLPSPYQQNEVATGLKQQTLPIIGNCFNEWQKTHPKFKSGQIKAAWEIQPNGKVENARITTSDITEIEECVTKAISETLFLAPPSDKPVAIEHTFSFPMRN